MEFSKMITSWVKFTVVLLILFGLNFNGLELYAEKDLQNMNQLMLPESDGNFSCLCFSADSNKLYAADRSDGSIFVWDILKTRLEKRISINKPIEWTKLIPIDENNILLADSGGDIWVLNVKENKFNRLFVSPLNNKGEMFVETMGFNLKTFQLNLIRANGLIDCLSYNNEQITRVSGSALRHNVRCAAFSKDCTIFATADWGKKVYVQKSDESKPFWSREFDKKIYDLSFAPNKKILIISQYDGTCFGINTENSQVEWKISCKSRLYKTRISQDGKYIYTTIGNLRKIRSKPGSAAFHVYRIVDGQLVFNQTLKGDVPKTLELSPDGKFTAVISEGKIFLWWISSN